MEDPGLDVAEHGFIMSFEGGESENDNYFAKIGWKEGVFDSLFNIIIFDYPCYGPLRNWQ